MVSDSLLDELIQLSLFLGESSRRLAILAEGNVSVSRNQESFWVKASGTQMANAGRESFVLVRFAQILEALSRVEDPSDTATRELLSESRAPGFALMPSVETFMHAYLLTLPEVKFVGHTHPTALIPLLCLSEASEICKQRLFPDEVVCCGPESAFVPYADPGLPLAKAIRSSVEAYVQAWGAVPKTIWLQNHGLIALGRSRAEIESASLMAAKAAEVWLGALSTKRKLCPMTSAQVERIHYRPDEHYRQKLLWQIQHESKI